MKIKDLKQILKLVSANGQVTEFVIKKDGSSIATSTDGTMMVGLKYNGIELSEDIAIDDGKKFLGVISRFTDETVVEFKDNQHIIGKKDRIAEIPRIGVEAIRVSKPIPEIAYAVTIPNVPLDKLKGAIKNQTDKIEEHYTFAIEEGMLKISVGNKEVGMITENILKVVTDKTLSSTFWVNVPQVINTLEGNPSISMGDNIPLKVELNTDKYSVIYLLAPRTDSS